MLECGLYVELLFKKKYDQKGSTFEYLKYNKPSSGSFWLAYTSLTENSIIFIIIYIYLALFYL